MLGYIASGAKLLGKKELQKRANEAKHKLEDRTKDVPYWALAGEIVGDPLNLTPAGVVSKGSKLARVAKSGLLGAGVGYTSMKAKNYGDDRLTNKQKEAQNVLWHKTLSADNSNDIIAQHYETMEQKEVNKVAF